MAKRFADVSVDDIASASSYKYSRATELKTKSFENLLQEFLSEFYPDIDLKVVQKTELINILKHFVLFLQTKKCGVPYKMSSLNSLKYSLRRYILVLRDFDISKDNDFKELQNVFRNAMNKSKESGKGTIEHHPDINKDDYEKIVQTLDPENAKDLQWLVFFYILLYFCRRGLENLVGMKKDHFVIKNINLKQCLVANNSELTKNHRENELDREEGGIICETNSDKCPIKIFKKYLDLLSKDSPYLWQLPLQQVKQEEWYHRKSGKNTISKFMPQISKRCNLSTAYTNHSIRATSCTLMGAHFNDTDVQAVSGHKSFSSLAMYKRVENSKKNRNIKCFITITRNFRGNRNFCCRKAISRCFST